MLGGIIQAEAGWAVEMLRERFLYLSLLYLGTLWLPHVCNYNI